MYNPNLATKNDENTLLKLLLLLSAGFAVTFCCAVFIYATK